MSSTITLYPETKLSRILYWFSILVLLVALGVSGYLSYLKLFPATVPACIAGGAFDCGTVLNSKYSEVSGVPIAYLGFIMNVVMLTFLILERTVSKLKPLAPVLVFFVALFTFLYSVYLVYLQAFVIGAFCPWCLTHEALLTLLFIASIFRLRDSMKVLDTSSSVD